MTPSPQSCSVDMCERSALAICECHNKQLCNDHFVEHTIQPASPGNETTVVIDQSINTSLNKQSCMTMINEWFRGIYRRVRYPQAKKGQESKETIDHQPIELNEVVVKANESRKDEDVVKDQRNKTLCQKLFPLEPPLRTIQGANKTPVSMACSKNYLLIEQRSNLCLLDRSLTVVKQIPWPHSLTIVCWSPALDQFILVTRKDIYTLDENTMELQERSIPHHHNKDWSCVACSDTTLYLSILHMSTSLYQYTLLPSIEFVKEWQLHVLCPTYESIVTLTYGNETLAFVICNAQTFQNRLDLYSTTTFEVLWSISLNTPVKCCSIKNEQWMIMNYKESQLLHLSFDGKILQDYKDSSASTNPIINALQWDNDTIITATMKSFNLHKLV